MLNFTNIPRKSFPSWDIDPKIDSRYDAMNCRTDNINLMLDKIVKQIKGETN